MGTHRRVFRVCFAGTWLAVLQACASVEHSEKAGPSVVRTAHASSAYGPNCASDGVAPSREGFFHELLFAAATARTPRFDDYTANSYHVIKLDLVQGLPTQAKACGLRLKAAVVVGPVGLLWTFLVAVLVQDGPNVRVNTVVMPHARITGKATGVISTQRALALLQQIEKAPLVRPGLPTPLPNDMESDFSYPMLLVRYDHEEPEYFHAELSEASDDPQLEPLRNWVNALLHTAKTKTYPHGQSM